MSSKDGVMASLLRDEAIRKYDIICIQEPWKNPFQNTTHNPAKAVFDLSYPTGYTVRVGVCMYVNRRIPKERIRFHFQNCSNNLLCLDIKMDDKPENEGLYIRVYNIYNPPRTHLRDGIPQQAELTLLETALARQAREVRDHPAMQLETIIVGDLNIHHPIWGGYHINLDRRSDQLIDLIDRHQLTQNLRRGTPTFSGVGGTKCSTIDLSFTTPGLTDRVIRCAMVPELEHGSDHFPIESILDLDLTEAAGKKTYAWDKVKVEDFHQVLRDQISRLPPLEPGADELDAYAHRLIEALQETTKATVPEKLFTSRTLPGFTPECVAMCHKVQRARHHFGVIWVVAAVYGSRCRWGGMAVPSRFLRGIFSIIRGKPETYLFDIRPREAKYSTILYLTHCHLPRL